MIFYFGIFYFICGIVFYTWAFTFNNITLINFVQYSVVRQKYSNLIAIKSFFGGGLIKTLPPDGNQLG